MSEGTFVDQVDDAKFIDLCHRHLMVPNLDNVVQTIWVQSKWAYASGRKCNVFLVGEVHSAHTKCTGILDTLQSLVDENDKLPRPIKFDLMIELLQGDRSTDYAEFANDPHELQMNSVRRTYMPCVEDRDCNMRVHWTDPSESKQIPEWLVRIQSFADVEDWEPDKLISSELRSPKDLIKILTENTVVMKEVDKASKVMPRFNRDFAAKIFLIIYRELSKKNLGWGYIVESLSRVVVDLYTVARIIKSQMTHVIYYAGNRHVGWCKHIFVYLGFVTKKTVVGTCVDRREKPQPNQMELTANTPHLREKAQPKEVPQKTMLEMLGEDEDQQAAFGRVVQKANEERAREAEARLEAAIAAGEERQRQFYKKRYTRSAEQAAATARTMSQRKAERGLTHVQQKFRERLTRKARAQEEAQKREEARREDEARWAAIQRNSRTAPNKYTRKSKENVGLLTRAKGLLSNLWN